MLESHTNSLTKQNARPRSRESHPLAHGALPQLNGGVVLCLISSREKNAISWVELDPPVDQDMDSWNNRNNPKPGKERMEAKFWGWRFWDNYFFNSTQRWFSLSPLSLVLCIWWLVSSLSVRATIIIYNTVFGKYKSLQFLPSFHFLLSLSPNALFSFSSLSL